VLHHLTLLGAPSRPVREPTEIDYTSTPFNISTGTPMVLPPPVTGKGDASIDQVIGNRECREPEILDPSGCAHPLVMPRRCKHVDTESKVLHASHARTNHSRSTAGRDDFGASERSSC
jgi:hypothetical protein